MQGERKAQKSAKLICDAAGYIERVVLLPENQSIEWCFDVSEGEAKSEKKEKRPPQKENESLPQEKKLNVRKDRIVDETLLMFEQKINECENIVEAVAFIDPVDDPNSKFHRVPRGVSLQWKDFVCPFFSNLDFCRGISVQKISQKPSLEKWKYSLERVTGRSVGDPGIALKEEIKVLQKYVFDFFPEDPIVRVSFENARPKHGPEGWKPQLTTEGKTGLFLRYDGKQFEYFVIVEDGLPPWTCQQIGILLDDCWSCYNLKFVVNTFNVLNELAKARREKILHDMTKELDQVDEKRDRATVVTNTFMYDVKSNVWYTGNGFINHKTGWHALPKKGSNEYIDVYLETTDVKLRCYSCIEDEIDKVPFQRVEL